MALIRWEPGRELGTIQSDINRLFNSFFDTPTRASGAPLRRYVPAMDLVDSGEAFVLKADLPGLSESDVNIEVVTTSSPSPVSASPSTRTARRATTASSAATAPSAAR